MHIFEYQAKEGPTKVVKGTIKAENEAAALQKLSTQGIVPLSIKGVSQYGIRGRLFQFRARGVRLKDIYTFTYQLVDLIASGLTIHNALDTIITQVENNAFKQLLAEVANHVREGMKFSEALALYKGTFNNFYISMVRAGEASGKLEEVLNELAQVLEKDYDFRIRIKQALAYPTLIAVCGIITIVAILTFVIPRLESMYADLGEGLPFITTIIIRGSDVLVDFWWLIGLIIVAVILYINQQLSGERGGIFFDTVIMKIPLWGLLIQKEEATRFTRSLGMLQRSGVHVLESLLIARDTLRSNAFRNDIIHVHNKMRQGSKMNEAMREAKSFSTLIINMVATGEESGMLDKSLERVSHVYEKEIDSQIKVITTLIEPLLVLCVGSIVGIIVISMLLPIFQITIFVE